MKKKLSVIVPCYNEEKVLEIFYDKLLEVLKSIKERYTYEILFVDDGSKDNTFHIICELQRKDKDIIPITFSRNFGKEAAIYAGLEKSTGDIVVVMDADLQHPPEVIIDMVKGIEDGFDSVTTKRINRNGESSFKKFFSRIFYKLMGKISSANIVQGAQDYRMMTREVVEAILSLKEYNRFSKGIFSWVGFKVKYIEVPTVERAAGETKWSFYKLFKYAIEGITSFSTAPLKLSMIIGIIISVCTFIYLIIIIFQTIIFGKSVPGYASIICTVLFMGGVQLLAIGVLGEYISKMYLEIKDRPKYIARRIDDVKDVNIKEKGMK